MSDELVDAIAEIIYDGITPDGVENPPFSEVAGSPAYTIFIAIADTVIDLFPDFEEDIRNILANE